MFTGSKTKLHPEASISEVKKASDQSIVPFNNSALNPNVNTERASPNLDKKGQSNALPNPSPSRNHRNNKTAGVKSNQNACKEDV